MNTIGRHHKGTINNDKPVWLVLARIKGSRSLYKVIQKRREQGDRMLVPMPPKQLIFFATRLLDITFFIQKSR